VILLALSRHRRPDACEDGDMDERALAHGWQALTGIMRRPRPNDAQRAIEAIALSLAPDRDARERHYKQDH
jgi:hypothetical protein